MISHDRRFLTNLSRATVWLDRGETRRIEKGFDAFEAWRDEVLAEEERDQHKLDRKIVAEEHWLRLASLAAASATSSASAISMPCATSVAIIAAQPGKRTSPRRKLITPASL